ncbi:MAG: beta-ketoacyl-ACP synthase [Myxococcales bacterium]
MSTHRVVITGIGLTSPIGDSLDAVSRSLRENKSGIVKMEGWDQLEGFNTRLGAVCNTDLSILPKKKTRTMGRVAMLSTWATTKAVEDSQLPADALSNPRTGLAYGSTSGSMPACEEYVRKLAVERTVNGIQSATYLRLMSHTAPANLAAYFSIRGRILTTCSACVSSSQAIVYGYEAIKYGLQDCMVCGGAEEMHITNASVFDIMFATSRGYNDTPHLTPRPFDEKRDGLVVGEGAGTLILESLEHAQKRGARIYAEIIGAATNCDGYHMTAPSDDGMTRVMQESLRDAQLAPDKVDYINAHATATDIGDLCESTAVSRVLGTKIPISSTKGFTGHTLGACGAIEAGFCLSMFQDGFFAPNKNLEKPDPKIPALDFVMGAPRQAKPNIIMTNNFAFAGINTSIILRRMA